jgi:hypothetical protein
MDLRCRNFLLAFMLAAAVVTSAFGQAAAPAASAAHDGSESAAFIPDFSGLWVHPLPGFEPLSSGPWNRRARRTSSGTLERTPTCRGRTTRIFKVREIAGSVL